MSGPASAKAPNLATVLIVSPAALARSSTRLKDSEILSISFVESLVLLVSELNKTKAETAAAILLLLKSKDRQQLRPPISIHLRLLYLWQVRI